MEFKASKKKLKVTIEGQAYEMACPSVLESEELNESLKSADPGKAYHIYADMFEKLGLPRAVMLSMDADDFLDFVTFVLSPKKKRSLTES
jgi:hypothetical protein